MNQDAPVKRKGLFRRHSGKLTLAALVIIISGVTYLLYSRGSSWGRIYRAITTTSVEAATTARIKTALALSQSISAFDIDVDTNGDTVRLSGTVPSESVRQLAVAITEDTAGVKEVDDALVVNPAARPDSEVKELRARVADLECKILVSEALRENPQLAGDDVKVSVRNRQVTLSGTVSGLDLRDGAERIARGIQGVESVINRIQVVESPEREGAEDADQTLAKQVQFELYATQAFDLQKMKISVQSGMVTLGGTVRSLAEKLLAEKIAADMEGVRKVINNLEVQPPEATGPAMQMPDKGKSSSV